MPNLSVLAFGWLETWSRQPPELELCLEKVTSSVSGYLVFLSKNLTTIEICNLTKDLSSKHVT